jgi:hypothetical protein
VNTMLLELFKTGRYFHPAQGDGNMPTGGLPLHALEPGQLHDLERELVLQLVK